jgi:hypothetical protein
VPIAFVNWVLTVAIEIRAAIMEARDLAKKGLSKGSAAICIPGVLLPGCMEVGDRRREGWKGRVVAMTAPSIFEIEPGQPPVDSLLIRYSHFVQDIVCFRVEESHSGDPAELALDESGTQHLSNAVAAFRAVPQDQPVANLPCRS